MKDSLIGINEGIEELTLTLLIGIKADFLQFILYPDKLLKLSNSLIILETETSKWSKYRIISSAYNEILRLWSWILIDTSDFLMACAKGSRDRQNNKGESGHPCLIPRCKGNGGEIILPVMTAAAGEWYNVLIIEMKCSPKPKHCRTAHILFHSSLSKAFSASSGKKHTRAWMRICKVKNMKESTHIVSRGGQSTQLHYLSKSTDTPC